MSIRNCFVIGVLFAVLVLTGCYSAALDTTENGVLSVTYLDENGNPGRRGVLVDGRLGGYSGEPMEVTPGHHVVSLQGPQDYEKPFEELVAIAENPSSLTFRKRAQ